MPDDPIEIKPKFGPFILNVNAIWRRLGHRPKADRVALAAQRFLELFEAHGVAATQIQQFLPQLTFDKVQRPESLMPSLTNEVLDQAAKLFGVRREWLEGVDDKIYDCFICYKSPEWFFQELQKVRHRSDGFPVRAFTCVEHLDYRGDREQLIAVVLVEKMCEIGEQEIFRYIINGGEWDWGYAPARIQLKAMVRVVDRVYGSPVPLYRAKRSVVEEIYNGKRVPREFMRGSPLTNPSLEDYACSSREHAQAKECDELPFVLEYINEHNLPTHR